MKKKLLLIVSILSISIFCCSCKRVTHKDETTANLDGRGEVDVSNAAGRTGKTTERTMPITFVNNTGVDIYYLYASTADTDDWEEDILDVDVLSYGDYVRVDFTFFSADTIWDFAIEDNNGSRLEFYGLDFSQYGNDGATIVLNSNSTANITRDADDFELPKLEINCEWIYGHVLDAYYEALANGWDADDMSNVCSSDMLMPVYNLGLGDIGYAFYDVNGDGVTEMLVGRIGVHASPEFIAMYAIESEEKVIETVVSHERSFYYLCEGGWIGLRHSGGAAVSGYEFYFMEADSCDLELQQSVDYDQTKNNGPWFINQKPVTETAAQQAIDSYKPVNITFTPFSAYEPSKTTLGLTYDFEEDVEKGLLYSNESGQITDRDGNVIPQYGYIQILEDNGYLYDGEDVIEGYLVGGGGKIIIMSYD